MNAAWPKGTVTGRRATYAMYKRCTNSRRPAHRARPHLTLRPAARAEPQQRQGTGRNRLAVLPSRAYGRRVGVDPVREGVAGVIEAYAHEVAQ